MGVLGYMAYFNIRNTLHESGTFLLGHPVYYVFSALKNEEVITSENLNTYHNMCHQIPYCLNGEVFHSDEAQSS